MLIATIGRSPCGKAFVTAVNALHRVALEGLACFSTLDFSATEKCLIQSNSAATSKLWSILETCRYRKSTRTFLTVIKVITI